MRSGRRSLVTEKKARGRATFWLLPMLVVASAFAVWWQAGLQGVREGATSGVDVVLSILPKLILGILLAGFAQVLVPRDLVARWLGERSGIRGIILASVAGTFNVGGPMTSFPMLVVLARAGADFGVLVAFLTAWSLLGLQRVIIWEISLLGGDFALLRFASCIVLPMVAGLIARHIVGAPACDHRP